MNRTSRCLEYAGVDPEWEARELRAFSAYGAIRTANAVSNYLLGRLLEEDLHVSCKPMLPANVQELNGSVLQGACLLQVVDIVNIGANFENRTEDTKGPTRTLKLCLTDGHQTVFGFEFKWLPALSVKTPRGTKVVVQNVAVRHGMLLLTPETCYVVGARGNDALDVAKLQSNSAESTTARPAGAYSAAIMTAGAELGPSVQEKPARNPLANSSSRAVPVPVQASSRPSSASSTSGPISSNQPPVRPQALYPREDHRVDHNHKPAAPRVFSPPRVEVVNPPVFVDISSDEDAASDITDPMVEHLFYSPNTPRIPSEASTSRPASASRKRPHPQSSRIPRAQSPPPTATEIKRDVVDMTSSPTATKTDPFKIETAFNLLTSMSIVKPEEPRTPIDLTSPYLYFNSRVAALNAKPMQVGSILTIRGFMKSVAGFQFNTGVFNLRVLIEDGTATQEVQVDPALVEALMGASCTEFLQAMKKTPAVAHRLAAKMQVTLMTMQGIMQLRLDSAPDKWTLFQCRAYTTQEAHALLARVKRS